jgi:hypothetical protein
MSDFWDRLLGKEKARRQTVEEKWQALVRALADGDEPATGNVEQTLQLASRTVGELRAAVDRLGRRRQAHAALVKARAVPAERERLRQLLAAADAALEAAVRAARGQHADARGPLEARGRELDALERAGADGLRVLEETAAPRPEEVEARLAEKRAELEAARLRQGAALHAANTAMRTGQDCVGQASLVLQGVRTPGDRQRALMARAAELEQEETRQRKEAGQAAAEVRRLEAELDQLGQLRLEP